MTPPIHFQPPSNIHFFHQGKQSVSSDMHCGVCHGALKLNESYSQILNKAGDNELLRSSSSSSSESLPLPSSASAVGTVHPCGHLFHVSCFHNHNNNKRVLKNGKCKNPMVEILDEDGGSCVELKRSDDFKDTLTDEDFNECPTCHKRAFLFVEHSSTVMHTLDRPLNDAIAKMTVESGVTEDDDDADTDIMNYYSFANTPSEDGDNLFVDTSSNVMAQINRHFLKLSQSYSHSDSSTEYHDAVPIDGKLASSAGSKEEGRDEQCSRSSPSGSGHHHREAADSDGVAPANKREPTLDSKTTKKLLYFDSRAMPTTPGIMVTPGTMQRRKANKKVRFFDDHKTHSLLGSHSGSGDISKNDKPALIDQIASDEDYVEEDKYIGGVELCDEDVREEPREGLGSLSEESVSESTSEGDNDSTNIPLASSTTEDSQDEHMLSIAPAFALPTPENNKMLFWNVSTIDEDDADSKENGFVDKLQREIDSLRHQLIQSEQEKEIAQRNRSLTRTGDWGTVSSQAKEIERLRKRVKTMKEQQTINQEEILATEEELAMTLMQLETAVESHQQTQATLQDKMDRAQEEVEEVQYQLETCQQQLETVTAEKAEFTASKSKCQEELKHDYEAKLEVLEKELSQTRSELEENKDLVADKDQRQKEHGIELEKLQQELKSAREELQTTQDELRTCQKNMRETAANDRASLEQSNQERVAEVKKLQETVNQTKTELEGVQEDLQKETDKNAAIIAKNKEDIFSLKEEYGAKLEGAYAKLALQLEEFREVENAIKQSQEKTVKIATARLETELESERKSNDELSADLEKCRQESELSTSELHRDIENEKKSNATLLSQCIQLEASRDQLVAELENQKLSNKNLKSLLDETKRAVEESLAEVESELKAQTRSYAILQSKLERTQSESEAKTTDLESKLARQMQSNAVLELQLEKAQEKDRTMVRLKSELQKQTQLVNSLSQLQGSNSGLSLQHLRSQEEMEKSIAPVKSELEKQSKLTMVVKAQLEQTQKQLEIANAELQEAKAMNIEESEEMTYLKQELELTRTDMEKLISNIQASDREMVVMRKELNGAKEAMATATHDIDLQRMSTSTSTSSLSPRHSADDSSCVHSLQDELRVVKQELAAKNEFIQGQLTMAKGKLVEYVRTKEGELEQTKRELSQTKIALKNKNITFARQLRETEHELLDLSSMKETLLSTMNELAEKNSIITSQLLDAQSELVFLAEENGQLREGYKLQQKEGKQQAITAPDLKFGGAFSVAAIFMGFLNECAKANFNLKNKPNHDSNQADPVPEIEGIEATED